MLYTLVIMMAVSHPFNQTGSGVTVQSVKGFTTEQACNNAAKKLKYPQTLGRHQISYTTSCIAMSI